MALTNETGIVTTSLTLRVSGRGSSTALLTYVGIPTAQHPQHTQLIYDAAKYHTKIIKLTKQVLRTKIHAQLYYHSQDKPI